MEDSKLLETMAQVMQTLQQQAQTIAAMERLLAEQGVMLRDQALLLQDQKEMMQENNSLLRQHSAYLQNHSDSLLRVKRNMEDDVCPKLDVLLEGQVNLAEQRDRDQEEITRRMKEVEDRSTILSVQMEALKAE